MPLIDRTLLNRRWLYSWFFGMAAFLLFVDSFLIGDRQTRWDVWLIALLLDLIQVITWVVLWRSRPVTEGRVYPIGRAVRQ
jgi:hypothetical protein